MRPKSIAHSLAHISGAQLHVSPVQRSGSFALVAEHGPRITNNVGDWTFPSTVDSIRCHYSELWLPVDLRDNEWELGRIYFHLLGQCDKYEVPREIVAFHWEPLVPVSDHNHGYSRRPHLHVSLAPNPFDRSHLVVTLTIPSPEQASITYLDKLIDEAVTLLKAEVLERIESTLLA